MKTNQTEITSFNQAKCLPKLPASPITSDVSSTKSSLFEEAQEGEGELALLRRALDQEEQLRHEQSQLNAKLQAELELVKLHHQERDKELAELRRDSEVLTRRLMEEIERRSEIQHANELIYIELEQLTQQLFQEANRMVETEISQRCELEQSKKRLESQLEEANHHLLIESEQLKELKEKMSELAEHATIFGSSTTTDINPDTIENLSSSIERIDFPETVTDTNLKNSNEKENYYMNLPHSVSSRNTISEAFLTFIDPQLYGEFESFVQNCQSSAPRKEKSQTLLDDPFVKRCVSEDIEPCLRLRNVNNSFYGKLISSIFENQCMIEEETIESPDDQENMEKPAKSTPAKLDSDKQSRPEFLGDVNPSSTLSTIVSSPASVTFRTSTPPTTPKSNRNRELSFSRGFSRSFDGPFLETYRKGLHGPFASCQLCGMRARCQFRYRLSETDRWKSIDIYCRDRLVAVCELYRFLKMLRQGLLVHRTIPDLYYEMTCLRCQIFYARTGTLNFFTFRDNDAPLTTTTVDHHRSNRFIASRPSSNPPTLTLKPENSEDSSSTIRHPSPTSHRLSLDSISSSHDQSSPSIGGDSTSSNTTPSKSSSLS